MLSLLSCRPIWYYIATTDQNRFLKICLIEKPQDFLFLSLCTADKQLDIYVFFQNICSNYDRADG